MESQWKNVFATEPFTTYLRALEKSIDSQRNKGIVIFPDEDSMYFAFSVCPFEKVRVVILGQDPYHGEGQAHGLAFSVLDNTPIPPSLKNIFKELHDDVGKAFSESGNLESWAKQGVLLLNCILSVEKDKPSSHQGLGWERFTDAVIKKVSDEHVHVVFLLWGKFAQSKRKFIDESKHLVLTASHPSPFSARTGFFGCKHFSRTNEYLVQNKRKPILW